MDQIKVSRTCPHFSNDFEQHKHHQIEIELLIHMFPRIVQICMEYARVSNMVTFQFCSFYYMFGN